MSETKPSFTRADVELVRETAQAWNVEMRRFVGEAVDWERTGGLARIAEVIEGELRERPATEGPAAIGFLPGDPGTLRAFAKAASTAARSRKASDERYRLVENARALRDLADRVATRVGRTKTFKNADGSSVTVTANTLTFKSRRRRK